MASDGKTTKTKVVDLQKLYNFVVDNFFIWIRLESQTLISSSVQHMWVQRISNIDTSKRCMEWLEKITRKAKVLGSKPRGREARIFVWKNARLVAWGGMGMWLTWWTWLAACGGPKKYIKQVQMRQMDVERGFGPTWWNRLTPHLALPCH
jgi:hypothetical protein